jgi:septal ring factor EnvC (AmiA/AmiB activator)
MEIALWQALIPLVAGGVIAAMPKILSARAENRRTDAETLAKSYALVIDELRQQVRWQSGETSALRDQITELMKMVNRRDAKIGALEAENNALRTRLDQLEAHQSRRRFDDPPPTVFPDNSDAT